MKKTNKKVPEAAPAKTNAGKQLATRPGNQLPAKPATAARGFENVERKDILIPRIQLLQMMSPAVTEQGMKPGTMHVGLSNMNYGDKIVITPIMHFRSRIKWVPQDDGGGIECSSPDARKPLSDLISAECGNCPMKDWDESKKGKEKAPACTLYENFLVLINDSTEPVLLPMERTKLKAAKKLYSMGALKNADMWNWQYQLGVSKEKNDKDQPYFNYTITDLAKATKDDKKMLCEQIWSSLSKKTIVTDMQNDDDAAGTAASQPANNDGKF